MREEKMRALELAEPNEDSKKKHLRLPQESLHKNFEIDL
jgi:hypothetical protein